MTELFVNGQRVVLPAGFSAKVKRENPFFTSNGDYTLDVELSLLHPVNARIFNHANRKNRQGDLPSGLSATLISDNRTLLKGVETIVKVTDTTITIQILSANSELNYRLKDVQGNPTKIWSMNLGTAPAVVTENIVRYSIDNEQNMSPGVYAPVFSKRDNILFNPWLYDSTSGSPVLKPYWYYGGTEGKGPWLIQPYLSYILETLFTELGYTLPEELFPTPYGLFILNGSFNKEYAKMLPDWTVVELLDKVESLFNGVFVADQHRNINYLLAKDYYLDEDVVIKDVVDEWEMDPAVDDLLTPKTANVSYKLPSSTYMAYQKLDQSILDVAEIINLSTYAQILEHATAQNGSNPAVLKRRIYHCNGSDTDYVCCWNESNALYLQRANRLKDLINTTNQDAEISQEITPSTMKFYEGPGAPRLMIQVPEIDTESWIDQDSSSKSIQEFLDESISVEGYSNDNLQLAFYKGLKNCKDKIGMTTLPYPISMIDYLSDAPGSDETLLDASLPSLRLTGSNGLYGQFYSQGPILDAKKERRFSFLCATPEKLDFRKRFLINGKRYVCKELEFSVSLDELSPLIEGLFFELL